MCLICCSIWLFLWTLCVFDMLQYLAVPVDSEVRVYENETWDLAFSLTDDSIKEVKEAFRVTGMLPLVTGMLPPVGSLLFV